MSLDKIIEKTSNKIGIEGKRDADIVKTEVFLKEGIVAKTAVSYKEELIVVSMQTKEGIIMGYTIIDPSKLKYTEKLDDYPRIYFWGYRNGSYGIIEPITIEK